MPGARCTRGLVCNGGNRTHTSNNEYTEITRHPRTQWFTAYFVISSAIGSFATVALRTKRFCPARLN